MRTTFLLSIMLLMSSCGTLRSIWSNDNARYIATKESLSAVTKSITVLINEKVITNKTDLQNAIKYGQDAKVIMSQWAEALVEKKENAKGFEAEAKRLLTLLTIINSRYKKDSNE